MFTAAPQHRQPALRTPPDSSPDFRSPKRARNSSRDHPQSSSNAPEQPQDPIPSIKKCDRVFPCQSCSKRGCAEICPDGALTSGRGSRFILANTEQLHDKIITMSDRIRQLEDALESLQSQLAPDPHPLLHPDFLKIKNSLELYSSQTTGQRSNADFTADENQANSSLTSLVPPRYTSPKDDDQSQSGRSQGRSSPEHLTPGNLQLHPEIDALSQTFPFPILSNNPMREKIYEMLPPRAEADRLCYQARHNALWQYNLDPSETWLPNLVHHIYSTPVKDLSLRRTSLLFIMMAIGLLVDLEQPNESPRAEIYHRLARACLCETNLMDEPSLELLQTLFYMIWYLLIFSDKSQAVAYAWSIMGLTVKLAHTVSDRDSNRWKVIPEEAQRRQMLFWELLNLDARLALSLGRPPSICLAHVDCRRPSYSVEGMYIIPGTQSYHEWKHGFFLQCLTPVLVTAISARPQQYSTVMEVDKTIRDFPIPPTLDIFNTDGVTDNRQLTMQQVLVSSGREIVLLQLHRNFFTDALSEPNAFSYRHRYAPSALATYLSATRLIATLEIMLRREPQLSKRFMCFWFNAFSGAVALSLIISRTPFISLAPFALRELEAVHRVFSQVAEECTKIAQALPLLTKITEKSRRVYTQWRKASEDETPMEIDESSDPAVTRRMLAPGPAVNQLREGGGTNPFENAHPHLLRCLEKIDNVAPQTIEELCAFTSPSRPASTALPQSITSASQAHTSDLSTEMLALALGQNESLIASIQFHSTDSGATTGTAGQRVGNHTFNFDFGALASNVESQSNTYMSWF
ncbi:hypothetical protein SERLA73DRAFT_169135 [Serpula lacrymans var. lacrymans S7.3]|uniref:4Fe-4S ferredoxin-type domain-containing protein n=2 Tax=Serpula lacrymans var. lacrymans TaxID=341189 RepID=F8Q174_SERL3|nr:uncharacterized protein SERLADRAFT_449988 [Serpula lacrymans var. lacrymans S7.9]EGN98052.1 hypothetical protein SERLA73DRAFT_169135 [Serpula lacrymans var. lacrymans S7.3]EGO23642.1 hypothetical protein SERLADRAFT_449988 [Serpula lacrymans var. lacrymans S7.9]